MQGCQRYWTAGGTLRNVPIGAGKRKRGKAGSGEGLEDVDLAASVPPGTVQQSSILPMQLSLGAAGAVPSPFSMFPVASSNAAPGNARLTSPASRPNPLLYNSFVPPPQLPPSANPWAPVDHRQYSYPIADSAFAWQEPRDPLQSAAAGPHRADRGAGRPVQPSARLPSAFHPSTGLGSRRGSIAEASSGLEDVMALDRQLSAHHDAAEASGSLHPLIPQLDSPSWPVSGMTPQSSQPSPAGARQQDSPSQQTEDAARSSSAEPNPQRKQRERQLQSQASRDSPNRLLMSRSPHQAGFQPFAPHSAAGSGKQHEITKPAAQDWISMAAAASQQQVRNLMQII